MKNELGLNSNESDLWERKTQARMTKENDQEKKNTSERNNNNDNEAKGEKTCAHNPPTRIHV